MRRTIVSDHDLEVSVRAVRDGRSSVVALRLLHGADADWLVVQTTICRVGEASLEGLLRRAAGSVTGMVVIEVDRCVFRERVPLGPLAAVEVHPLVDRVIADARALREPARGRLPAATV